MEELLIKIKLRGFNLTFKTRPGVFSKHRIDPGTELLINSLAVRPDDTILDLGCGYGPVGITTAKLAPRGKTILVDANIRAVRLTEENIKLNQIKNAEALLSDGLEAVASKENAFNIIASNPPESSGLDIFEEFTAAGKKLLKTDGRFYFVTQERLLPAARRCFEKTFRNYEMIKRSRGYGVSLARKEN